MSFLHDWALSLRLARRLARRSIGKTALIAALVGLPVLAGSWFSVVHRSTNPTGETFAHTVLGTADAQLSVSMYRAFPPLSDRPGLALIDRTVPGQDDHPARTPATFDVGTVLPAGTRTARAITIAGEVELRGPGADLTASLRTGDLSSPLTAGTFRLDSGRMPVKPGEVALSPALADHLGLRDGDVLKPGATLVSAAGAKYAVVGIARTLDWPDGRTVFATPSTPLNDADPLARVDYLVDLPDHTGVDALVTGLNAQGMTLVPRADVIDPPDELSGPEPAGTVAARVMVISFGVLELVLLAGTAFAVVARRQTRDLGLVLAMGGTASDIRRIVLAQGLFAGLLGAIGGLGLGIAAALVGKGWWEQATATLITAWQLPWTQLIGVVIAGPIAGLATVLVPAIGAARRTPLAALAGRFASAVGSARLRKPAIALVVAGIGCSIVGNLQLSAALDAARADRLAADPQAVSRVASASPTPAVALVVAGISLVVAGVVWMSPAIVAKLAGPAGRLPLSPRLALRDASRHRHRTGPVIAAIMIAVAGTTALGFAVVNKSAAAAQNYEPQGLPGDAVLQFGELPYSPGVVTKLQSMLPLRHTFEIGSVSVHDAKEVANDDGYDPGMSLLTADGRDSSGYPLLAVDPAYIARFEGYGPKAAAALRQGKVVVPLATLMHNGRAGLGSGDGSGKSVTEPAIALPPPRVGLLTRSALISTDTARRLGRVGVDEVHFELTRPPSAQQLAAVARLLGHEDLLKIENGYHDTARQATIGLLALGTTATLLGVGLSLALSLSEGRADFATLAAVGAPPRRRRRLAAAQGWFVGQVGCVLGLLIGALYGFAAHTVVGSPRLVVPWPVLGGIVLLVPLFAAAMSFLMTRSRLELVRRAD